MYTHNVNEEATAEARFPITAMSVVYAVLPTASLHIHLSHEVHTSPFTPQIITLARATIQPHYQTHIYIQTVLARQGRQGWVFGDLISPLSLPRCKQKTLSSLLPFNHILTVSSLTHVPSATFDCNSFLIY